MTEQHFMRKIAQVYDDDPKWIEACRSAYRRADFALTYRVPQAEGARGGFIVEGELVTASMLRKRLNEVRRRMGVTLIAISALR